MRLPIRLLCVVALALAAVPRPALAQGEPDDSIFRRFSTPARRSEGQLTYLEMPITLRPQTDSGATVTENLGIGYTIGFQPFRRGFQSVGYHFARMEWRPSNTQVLSHDVKEVDVVGSINLWVGRSAFVTFGIGLGIMDSVALNAGSFEHNLVPYLPVRTGVTLVLADSWLMGLHWAATPYFGQGQNGGHSRLLLGLGWTH